MASNVKGLTRLQAIVIVVAILVVALAGAIYVMQQRRVEEALPTETTPSPTSPLTTPTTSPLETTPPSTPSTTTPPPTPSVVEMTIGSVTIRVPYWLYDFANKCKVGEIDRNVTIVFWTQMMPFEEDVIRKVVEEFRKEFPCINIEYENIGGGLGELKNRIMAGVQVGEVGAAADIFTWAHDWTGELAEGGYIIPLDKYLPQETLEDLRKQYLTLAYNAGYYNLRLYALPWAAEAIALIYNKAMVSEPPETFDELENIMKQYYNPGEGTYGIAMEVNPYMIYPWITAFNGFYYDEATDTIGVNSTGTKEGVKFFLQHILPYMDTSDLGHERQLKLFQQNRTPFLITGPWDIPGIRESLGENFGVAPIPRIGDKIPKPFIGIKVLWLSSLVEADSPDKPYRINASLLFILWFTLNDNTLKYLIEQAGFIPVKLSVLDYINENRDKYPIVFGFAQSVAQGVLMPKSPKMSKVWYIGTCLNSILQVYQTKGLDAALEAVDNTLNQCYVDIVESMKE